MCSFFVFFVLNCCTEAMSLVDARNTVDHTWEISKSLDILKTCFVLDFLPQKSTRMLYKLAKSYIDGSAAKKWKSQEFSRLGNVYCSDMDLRVCPMEREAMFGASDTLVDIWKLLVRETFVEFLI